MAVNPNPIQTFWSNVPETWKSALVSYALGGINAFSVAAGIALTQGALNNPQSAWAWLCVSWWGILIGYVLGGAKGAQHRAAQAQAKIDSQQ